MPVSDSESELIEKKLKSKQVEDTKDKENSPSDSETYEEFLQGYVTDSPHFLYSYHLNLTENICDKGKPDDAEFIRVYSPKTADGLFACLLDVMLHQSDRDRIRKVLDCKRLIRDFEKNHVNSVTEEFSRFMEDGNRIRVRITLRLVRNTATGNIEAFFHAKDITQNYIEKKFVRSVIADYYDFIGYIDKHNGRLRFLYTNDQFSAEFPDTSVLLYKDFMIPVTAAVTGESEQAQIAEDTVLRVVTNKLRKNQRVILNYSTKDDKGQLSRKVLNYQYADEYCDTILFSRNDITDAYVKENNHANDLSIALAAAQQASEAKTSFLSRMSHDIRTPMNAIIGMDTLAAQALGDDERVADCISKIGISARYLLSLINDILDMSRIESGKMLLKHESFVFADLINSVSTLVYQQTQQKGIDYECIIAPGIAEAYIGDVGKLQQVIINVLGNAVKFTDRGRVQLEIHPISRTNKTEKIRIVISDTGVGISEKDQAVIFEPFEQTERTDDSSFGGSGLGLAITKNLVELMNGTIRVRSIVDVGSEFTIDLPLTIDDSVVVRSKYESSFETLKTLVVDDDAIICEQTVEILKEIRMKGEWVTSGREAVKRVQFQAASSDNYDFILIDWKMPDMDGIETTRQIRKIVGPEVTIIIISAYDWQSIEREARAAGANMLVTKPLFKATLVSAFEKAMNKVDEQEARKTLQNLDFQGKRVLLAEDNKINAEIARALLENKNIAVDVAENGLQALQKFTNSEEDYYSAILMDVRMPQMDGLQTTSSIRHWNRPDATKIPIIAMTANAFDEDVEKSMAAGMNTHLSKPIDADLLYMTLNRFIFGRDDEDN